MMARDGLAVVECDGECLKFVVVGDELRQVEWSSGHLRFTVVNVHADLSEERTESLC